jgi:hypothetical protein
MRLVLMLCATLLLAACADEPQVAGPAPLPAHPVPEVSKPAELPPVGPASDASAKGCRDKACQSSN